ncbi:37S ribosomal protein S23 mitochondrial [Tulasnella sp. 419]|nr:37S ribosomal protein S23 mitochondrial [Tulasnella sp. 419]
MSTLGRLRPLEHAIYKIDHPLVHGAGKTPALTPLDPKSITATKITKAVAFASPKLANSPLNVFGMPQKVKEEFKHAEEPFSVIRQPTVSLLDALDKAAQPPHGQGTRLVLAGEAGSGKSILMMQAVDYCSKDGWIVLYVPHASSWVNSTTPYKYDYRSQTFHQPALAADILTNMLKFNKDKISKMKSLVDLILPGAHGSTTTISQGSTIENLVNTALRDTQHAPQILVAVLDILAKQTTHPVLFAIDEFQALYNESRYRDPQFKIIKSYNLSTPRLFLEYASGKRPLARGMVLGSLSLSSPQYPVPLELHESLELPHVEGRKPGPYVPRSEDLLSYAEGLKAFNVPNAMSTAEAASLLDAWNKKKLFHSELNDTFFHTKYVETGGNPRQLVSKAIRATLTM